MALRSTYDTGEYGSGLYGEPETTQGAVAVSFGVSASASAVTVVNASASASISVVTNSPDAQRLGQSLIQINILSITTSVAVEYDSVAGFRDGYGLNTYG